MPLRAEQWMMLGVVAIGGAAVYLMTRARPRANETPILTAPSNMPDPATLRVPNIIGRNLPPGQARVTSGTPYRGRIESSNPTLTARTLEALGFTNVRVYTLQDVQTDPDLVPLPDAVLGPSATSRWFSAVWRGRGPAAVVSLPPEVRLLWITVDEPRPRALASGFAPTWSPLTRAPFVRPLTSYGVG